MKILVVDDDPLFLKIVSEMLEEAGHDFSLAANGEEAIDKAGTYLPDLIILDIILPKHLGTEVCEKLRTSCRTAPIPILLVTGIDKKDVDEGVIDYFQADDFLRKPFEAEDLIEKVSKLAGSTSKFA